MAVTLDLRKAFKHQRHGDLFVILTWVNDERALVLAPSLRPRAGWYIVQESAAYRWGVDHPDGYVRREAMAHAVNQSHIACDMLGLEPSRMNRAKVISVITGWIPDLCRMPASPPVSFKPGAFGQMIMSADGKPFASQDMREEVAGVEYG